MTYREKIHSGIKANENALLLCLFFFFLALPLFLMLGRALDTNTLVSWQWTMGPEQPIRITFLLIPLLAAACVFSKKRNIFESPLVLGGITALTALPFILTPEPVIDAGRYFIQAKAVADNGVFFFWNEWGREIFSWTDLPMVPFFHGLWITLWGEERIYSQLLSVLFFIGLVLMTSLLGQELWDRKAGIFSGWLILASPYLLFLSSAFLVDIPAAFFTMGVLLFYIRFLKNGRFHNGSMAAMFLVLAMLTKYSLWLFLPILISGLFAGCVTRDRWRRGLFRVIAVCCPALVGLMCFAITKWESIARQFQLLTTFQAVALSRWDEGFWSTFFFQVHPVVLGLACFAFWVALKKKDRSMLLPLAAFLIVVFLPTNRIRYLVPLLPLVCLAAARGLELFSASRVRRFAVYAAVATSVCVTMVAYLPFARSTAFMNITEAGRFLNTLPGKGVRVHFNKYNQVVGLLALVPLVDMATTKKICLETEGIAPPPGVATSPLRFTWEMDLGNLYKKCGADSAHFPRVVLADVHTITYVEPGQERPVVFARATDAFVFRPKVAVFAGASSTHTKKM